MKRLLLLALLQFPVSTPVNQDQWVVGIGQLEALASGTIRSTVYQQTSSTTGNDSIVSLGKASTQTRTDIDIRISHFNEDLCISNVDLCRYLLSKYNLRWTANSPLAVFGVNPTPVVNPFVPTVPVNPPSPVPNPFIPPIAPNPFGR